VYVHTHTFLYAYTVQFKHRESQISLKLSHSDAQEVPLQQVLVYFSTQDRGAPPTLFKRYLESLCTVPQPADSTWSCSLKQRGRQLHSCQEKGLSFCPCWFCSPAPAPPPEAMGFVEGGEGETNVASPARCVHLVVWFLVCLLESFYLDLFFVSVWGEWQLLGSFGFVLFTYITGAQNFSPRRRKRLCFTK